MGEPINVVVPTGNFGNILAAYYAKQMGIPIARLICASNENKVLYDFFGTGTYDKNREFILTSSPSMDILVSSNLERLIYQIAGQDDEKNRRLMAALSEQGNYQISPEMKAQLSDFYGNFAGEEETAVRIRELFEKEDYLIDPHTAVASCVDEKYRKDSGDSVKTVIVSTASPYKFTRSVMNAIDGSLQEQSDFALADELEKRSKVKVPKAVEEIRDAEILHKTVCETDEMEQAVREFLGL